MAACKAYIPRLLGKEGRMYVRKYVGYNHNAVLDRIKEELGPDAVILYSSYKKPPSLLSFLMKSRYEIIAGNGFNEGLPAWQAGGSSRNGKEPVRDNSVELREIRDQLKTLTKCVRNTAAFRRGDAYEYLRQFFSAEISQLYAERLPDNCLSAENGVSSAPDSVQSNGLGGASAAKGLLDYVAGRIKTSEGITFKSGAPTRVAIVGPTGVGKTTTIAKLMSIYTYKRKRVSVLTNDNYRIAAYEQLKRICELVGTEIKQVVTPDDVSREAASFGESDLIFMDTAGRGQSDSKKIMELVRIVRAFNPDEVHLVISCNTDPATMKQIAEKFEPCGVTHMIVTKIDESAMPGNIMDVVEHRPFRLSFLAKGQKIPQDIEIADSERLASIILRKEAV